MAYTDFKRFNDAIAAFNLSLISKQNLFAGANLMTADPHLLEVLSKNLPLAVNIGTEKARSELIVTPILLEIYEYFSPEISYFSGVSLNVDPAKGLNGECDFLLSLSTNQFEVSAPVVTIVEAKNDSIKSGLGQCVAQMVGASQLNSAQGRSPGVYGAVTTGVLWRFLRLLEDGISLQVDMTEYVVPQQLSIVLSVLAAPFGGDSTPWLP